MTVYVVYYTGEYDEYSVAQIFSTAAKAAEYISHQELPHLYLIVDYIVDEEALMSEDA
jgi:hypothetical protein